MPTILTSKLHGLMTASAVAVALLALAGADDGERDVLRVRHIAIVDEQGRTLITLGGAAGGGEISVFDPDSGTSLFQVLGAEGSGLMRIGTASGSIVGVTDSNGTSLLLTAGESSALLSAATDHPSGLTLIAGKAMVAASAAPPGVVFQDASGERRCVPRGCRSEEAR